MDQDTTIHAANAMHDPCNESAQTHAMCCINISSCHVLHYRLLDLDHVVLRCTKVRCLLLMIHTSMGH